MEERICLCGHGEDQHTHNGNCIGIVPVISDDGWPDEEECGCDLFLAKGDLE